MIRKTIFVTALFAALAVNAQETVATQPIEVVEPDSALHLPTLNAYGQMPSYINRWTMYGLTGYYDWDLHRGLNMNLGASVFASLGSGGPSGAGFAQNLSGMYALPLSNKLSLAVGGYFVNANWAGRNLRDAGLNAVLGYRFDEHWEAYLYGQKSLMRPKIAWPFYDMNELGDRLGAALRYNFNPSFSIQLNVEHHNRK